MKIRLLYVLFITVLMTISGVSSGAVTGEHTIDEWKAILDVPSDSGKLTGLQISLSIDPDQYYLPFGSMVNLTGDVYNIFGPVDNASVILAKGEGGKPVPFENVSTNENGEFSTVDMVNSSLPIRYQAWFEGSDNKRTNRTLSNEVEIIGEQSGRGHDAVISDGQKISTKPGLNVSALISEEGDQNDGREEEDDSYIFPVVITGVVTGYHGPESDATMTISLIHSTGEEQLGYRISDPDGRFEFTHMIPKAEFPVSYLIKSDLRTSDSSDYLETQVTVQPPVSQTVSQNFTNLNLTKISEQDVNLSGFPGISFGSDTDVFTSGQNVTFSGVVTGLKGTSLSYAGVTIEQKIGGAFTRIGDLLNTDRNGTYSISYHLTGPSSPIFRAVSSDEKGNKLVSGENLLSFQSGNFTPLSRDRMKSRHIDGILIPPVIRTGENITISGWFADGNGDGIPAGRLSLYWFNFADRIWDRYEPSSEAITNEEGYYSFMVNGPKTSGISYLAVVSKREQDGDPLFSSVLALTVRGDQTNTSPVLPVTVTVDSNPPEVKINNQAVITFTLSDLTGTPLAGEALRLYFSEDGFAWFMNGNGNVTTNTEGVITMTDSPKRTGFHYYRGVYDGSALYGPADSGVLVIPVLDSSVAQIVSKDNSTPGLSGTDMMNTTGAYLTADRESGNISIG